MADYPDVGQEELRFDVIINPCLVTSLTTAVTPEKVEYIVGNIQKSITYSFTQVPCSYDATYTLVETGTSNSPSYIEQLDRLPIFNIYTVDEQDVGNYTMTVTVVLDNVALFNSLDPSMTDYIADINDPAASYLSQHSGNSPLVYTATFDFDLEILPPESDYEEPDNTNPYLLPPPVSQDLEIGAERRDYFLGDIKDNEAVNQTITIEVTIDSRAQKFLEWRENANELIMRGEEADVNDLGQYDV